MTNTYTLRTFNNKEEEENYYRCQNNCEELIRLHNKYIKTKKTFEYLLEDIEKGVYKYDKEEIEVIFSRYSKRVRVLRIEVEELADYFSRDEIKINSFVFWKERYSSDFFDSPIIDGNDLLESIFVLNQSVSALEKYISNSRFKIDNSENNISTETILLDSLKKNSIIFNSLVRDFKEFKTLFNNFLVVVSLTVGIFFVGTVLSNILSPHTKSVYIENLKSLTRPNENLSSPLDDLDRERQKILEEERKQAEENKN